MKWIGDDPDRKLDYEFVIDVMQIVAKNTSSLLWEQCRNALEKSEREAPSMFFFSVWLFLIDSKKYEDR